MINLIGRNVLDNQTGKNCIITDITTNSIEIKMPKIKKNGITSKNWFTMETFKKRFILL